MLKIFLAILLFSICFSLKTESFSKLLRDSRLFNERILRILELLEQRPLIASVSLNGGNFTLDRKPFEYNPGKYLGNITNALNERLPNENIEYFDLSDTLDNYEKLDDQTLKMKCIDSYVSGLRKLEKFLNHTWETEKTLREQLGIIQNKFENVTFIEGRAIGNNQTSIFSEMKFNFPITKYEVARGFITNMIGYIVDRVEIFPKIDGKDKKKRGGKKQKGKKF